MFALVHLLFALLLAPFRSKLALEAENAALRQQIIVLRRKLRGRVRGSARTTRKTHTRSRQSDKKLSCRRLAVKALRVC